MTFVVRLCFAFAMTLILSFRIAPVAFAQATNNPAAQPASSDESPPEKDPELPTLNQVQLPSFARLIEGPAFDRIVITGDKVIEVEPLYPRPGTIDDLNSKLRDHIRKVGAAPQKDEDRAQRQKLFYLYLTLLTGEDREYRLHRQYIKEIIYYEDLMLRRIDLLLDERKVREAFLLISALVARQTNWTGITARQERLLLTEATIHLEARQSEPALVLLEELHDRNSSYPGLSAAFGTALDQLVIAAQKQDDFRQARSFLQRVKKREPNHPAATRWTNSLSDQVRKLIADAAALERDRRFDEAAAMVEKAARVWPTTPELVAAHRRVINRYQRLHVGVLEVPRFADVPPSYWADFSAGDVRQRNLTQVSLFQPARVDGKLVRYGTPFFDAWEPTDLGHRLTFQLRLFREGRELLPAVSAGKVAAGLAQRITPGDPQFDERFASYVASIAVTSPQELTVEFQQAPLRTEALFAFPLADAPGSFRVQKFQPDGEINYQRSIPEPDEIVDRHVAEIVETKYESHEKALQALYRGEVSMLANIPAWQVKTLSERSEFFTLPYALPVTHMLQFAPDSPIATSRTFRRALVYAINRPQLLEDHFLHEPPGRMGRVTSSPISSTNYAYNPLVEPHKHDAALGLSLAAAAKKELGGELPPLTLLVPSEPHVLEAARQIVEQWKNIGVQATLYTEEQLNILGLTAREKGHEIPTWNVVYRRVCVHEPLLELWPLLTGSTWTSVKSSQHLPTWLGHDLLALDAAGDMITAENILRKLHRQLWAEVYLIPLWELNEYLVARKHVRGIPLQPLHTYHGVERWKVDSWYPRD